MRIHRRTIFASIACAFLSMGAFVVLFFASWNAVFFGVCAGILVSSIVALLVSANAYRAQRQVLLSEMLVLIAQIKGVCNRIVRAESCHYPDRVDLLLHSYHTIKNCYALLIRYVLDFDPLSRRLSRRVVLLSEEVHMLECRLKDQIRMSAPMMKKTYGDLIDSLPYGCIDSMERFIANRVLTPKQRELYLTMDQHFGDVLDVDQSVARAQ